MAQIVIYLSKKILYSLKEKKVLYSLIKYIEIQNEELHKIIKDGDLPNEDIKFAKELIELISKKKEIILVNMIIRYKEFSGLDYLACLYILESNQNEKITYLNDEGPQKKESKTFFF